MPITLGAGERETLEWITPERVRRPFAQFDQLQRAGAADVVRELRALPEETGVDEKTWELPDRWLAGAPTLPLRTRTLRALPTPGHTRGHYVFWDADASLLFAGDHVLPEITPSIGFEAVPEHSPLSQYLSSLLLVRTMPDARLLPAHGPVTDSVHARVDVLLSHHAARLDATLAAMAAGASTAREVADRLDWTRRARRLAELDVFNRMLAVLETAAHLAVLAERGLVTAIEVDGVVRYS
jgi:glyoxylase-like metal-dependent hydrolase (beta-lactamase superfamily II)